MGTILPGGRDPLPLYEYRCTSCGHTFEKIQKYSDAPETVCPKCHGELIRPVTAPALRFEGAGWYVNDYAGKGGAASTETAISSEPESSASTATEKKPASTDGAASSAPAPASTTPAPAAPAPSKPASSASSSSAS
jgi:putative FmdB family regulatory protein